MLDNEELRQTFQDICVLYELALATSTSAGIQENCRGFLTALAARKGFSFVAVWIRSAVLPGHRSDDPATSELALVYGAPRVHVREQTLPLDHPAWKEVRRRGPFSVAFGESGFPDLVFEEGIGKGAYALFPLGDLGFLKAYSQDPGARLDAIHLAQLDTVVRKFASSLEGSIALERLVEEAEERRRSEEEKRAIQDQLRQAQKMEALGRLAGGVAHDFNNLLSGILGTVELLLMEDPGENVRNDLQVIGQAATRAAELTRQLLAFARTRDEQHVPVALDALVKESVALLRRTFDAKIEIRTDLGLGETLVDGVPNRLHTVLINLAVNARDAMPEGGILTLETRRIRGPDPSVPSTSALTERSREWARVRVRDTGCGMPAYVAERAFEPFFTTKDPGEGTGLGLSTVYGIIKSQGGQIHLSSQPGQGTNVEVLLPVVDEAVTSPCTSTPFKGVEALGGVVLMADDQEGARRVTVRLLERLGFAVVEAEDGLGAVERALQHRDKLVAAVLDVQMPGVDGVEALRRIRDAIPNLPAVMVSGYAHPSQSGALAELAVHRILQKPFRMEDLKEALGEAMTRR